MTRGAKYLRDARHLNKFLFTLSNELFYEPFESHYEPLKEYIDIITDLSTGLPGHWRIAPEGFWVHVHPYKAQPSAEEDPRPRTLPTQGWKVHVSATISNHASILRKAARVALTQEVAFKVALDRNILSLMSSKAWSRSGSGKFITMYPSDLSCFKVLLEELYAELQGEEGPYILSDNRYRDCRILYYRFGGIEQITQLEITGTKTPILTSPDGERIPDTRTPYFAPPPWVVDPFSSQEESQNQITLNGGRYSIKEALAFSNSGGVYLAEDRDSGSEVVIKEARAHTLMDGRGNDAIKLLKKEYELLQELRDTGIAAQPLESFHAWENCFLVEEYVTGNSLREIILTRSPLMQTQPSLEDSKQYYEVFKKLLGNFAQRLGLLHERGIVFGDLSHNNLRIDPSSWTVRFIDFEGAFRPGVDTPTYLYTPGFKSESSIREDAQGFEEDLYSLAAIMLYVIFPISALASLRGDLYDTVLRNILSDIGWSQTEVLNIINGLLKNEITCARACALLDQPVKIQAPKYEDDIEDDFCSKTSRELGSFLLANIRIDSNEGLFPADPFVHKTNYLSLGFGAGGVLYVLEKCGFEIPRPVFSWLEQQLEEVNFRDLAPGLLTGSSGMAWCFWDLGFEEHAEVLMKLANGSPLLKSHHSYLYGMAGVGMANLYFHLRTGSDEYLASALDLADTLCRTAKESGRNLHWEDSGLIQVGLGYGQSGVALFFLRLFQITGREEYLNDGRRALEFDLSHAIENENGGVSFPCSPLDPTLLNYLEEGSAGIAKVAIRYGMWDRMEAVWPSVHRKYAIFPGLLYGLGSFVDVLIDAFVLSRNRSFLEMARRPLAGIRDLYLLEQPTGLATPGEGLLRISCDYATGVAGVLRAFHRFSHLGEADFLLDEVALGAGNVGNLTAGNHQRRQSPTRSE